MLRGDEDNSIDGVSLAMNHLLMGNGSSPSGVLDALGAMFAGVGRVIDSLDDNSAPYDVVDVWVPRHGCSFDEVRHASCYVHAISYVARIELRSYKEPLTIGDIASASIGGVFQLGASDTFAPGLLASEHWIVRLSICPACVYEETEREDEFLHIEPRADEAVHAFREDSGAESS